MFFLCFKSHNKKQIYYLSKKEGEKNKKEKKRRKKEENLKPECFGTSTKLHLQSTVYMEIFVLNRVCVLCVSVCYRKTDVSMLNRYAVSL